ncbi:MAG: RNase H family protein [Candidatus Neomarinimicrobiota bacterium]
MYDPRAIKIYIDGSAYGNPGHMGGIGGVIEYPESLNMDNEKILEETYQQTTNNRMELLACIKAFRYTIDHTNQFKSWDVTRVIIVSDSKYVVNNYTSAYSWKSNKWRNRAGRPIENDDLWKNFISTRSKIKICTELIWQLGKSNEIVKIVDKTAKKAAKKAVGTIDYGYKLGRACKAETKGGASSLFEANGQKEIIKIYRYRLSGKEEYMVFFDLYSKDNNCFLGKFRAYIDKRKKESIHRHSWCEVIFNVDAKYPIIESIVSIESLTPSSQSNSLIE